MQKITRTIKKIRDPYIESSLLGQQIRYDLRVDQRQPEDIREQYDGALGFRARWRSTKVGTANHGAGWFSGDDIPFFAVFTTGSHDVSRWWFRRERDDGSREIIERQPPET